MARKKAKAPAGPNNGYLISFGDTMTALLAFFIVLNSLASEQTGAALHSGTGSFMKVSDGMGVPGLFSQNSSSISSQFEEPSPLYIVSEDGEEHYDSTANGPDADGDDIFVRDREQENYERFLSELERLHQTEEQEELSGEVAFDRLQSLPHSGKLLDASMEKQLLMLVPVLQRQEYEVEIRIWATTPAKSSWLRAANQSKQILDEVSEYLKLDPAQKSRLTATASPWFSSDLKRPSLSFLLRKTKADL